MATHLRGAFLALIATSAFSFAGCSKDPYDPQTWIDKLEEPAELEEAITNLERLKCPQAIEPLGEVWEKHNKWSKVLRVIIDLADQPNMNPSNDAWKRFKKDCKNPGEGPYWDDAIPVLITAVEDFDVTDEREIQDAAVAAEALGKAKATDAIQVLISAATKKEKLRQGQMVRIAAIKALGEFGNNPRAIETIVKILEGEATRETILLNAAAANALAQSGSEVVVVPLLTAMFEVSPIYQQVRTALTSIGKPVIPHLVRIFKGTHTEINKVADENKFAKNCAEGEGPGTECIAPGNLRFKSATLLGDMRATEAVGDLVAALKQEGAVSFFDPNTGAPGPSDHNAIVDALRTMGAFKAANDLKTYMMADKTDDLIRPLAIDAYSMLGRDTSALSWLEKTFEDTDNEMPMRQAATLAYARLVTEDKQIKPIQDIIDRQLKSAKESQGKANKAKTDDDKGQFEGEVADYLSFAREYEQHRTRARAGVVCKGKVECYIELLTLDADGIVKKLGIPNHRPADVPMKKQDKQNYRIAAVERAMIDIAKLEEKGAPALDALLKHADSTERIIRQGVLLAMVQVAPSPCNECASRLKKIIDDQSAQTTLDYLTSDTRIVLNYFLAQGAKVDSAKKEEAKEAE